MQHQLNKTFILCLVMLIASFKTQAQEQDKFYKIEHFDSLRVEFFSDILKIDPNQSLNRAKYILTKSTTDLQKMNAKQCLGVGFMINKIPDSARYYFYEAIDEAKNMPDKKYFVSAVINYSNLDLSYKKNDKLISLLYEALTLSERDDQKALLYQFLGEAYYKSEDLIKAEEFYLKALPLVGENKTNIYRGLEGLYFRKKEYKKALNYILKSINQNKEQIDVNLAFAYLKAGRNYLFLNDLINAEKYLKLSIETQKKINAEVVLGEYYYYMALLAKKQQKPEEIYFLDKAENEIVASQDHYFLKDVYLKKSNFYARKDNNHLEDLYLDKYLSLHDSLFTSEKNSLKASLETKFKVRENEIEIKNKELIIQKEKKQKQRYLIFSILLTLLIISVIYFYRKQLKLKDILSKEKLEKLRKDQELEVLKAKTKERNMLSKKLHDEVASDIFAAKIKLEGIKKENSTKNQILNTLNNIYLNVRDFSHNTRSVDLSVKSFSLWVNEICEDILSNDPEVNIVIHNSEKINALNESMLHELLLIIKECAINTKKHANASSFELQMTLHSRKLFISIKDNGKGTTKLENGIGLKNLQDRVKNLNGVLTIDAKEGFNLYIEIETALDN